MDDKKRLQSVRNKVREEREKVKNSVRLYNFALINNY